MIGTEGREKGPSDVCLDRDGTLLLSRTTRTYGPGPRVLDGSGLSRTVSVQSEGLDVSFRVSPLP